ncbi:MAG: zf-HC2 domain-containing protein [Candidatus Omnitrophica bacterium]|nr:zf-HC2 domain-containing protein [Candidatus Omnitrophota bacterium]
MRCPDEAMLSSYLDESLSEAERGRIEQHVSSCARCLDLLVVAYESGQGARKCPRVLRNKIKARLGLQQRRGRPELKWLFASLVLFLLSFVFKKYFLQFLIAAAILGFKWVMEGEGAKRAIMIFRGMREEEDHNLSERSTTPSSKRFD